MEKILPKVFQILRSKKLLQAEVMVLILLIVITAVTLIGTNLPIYTVTQTTNPIALSKPVAVETKKQDIRVTVLRAYLAKKNSPLVAHAEDFVEAADTYDVDWKLVPAISGVESSFGQFIPGGHELGYTSYNGWGWGVYGTQSLKFKSWREGIFTVTEGLKTNYINKGLTTPIAMNHVYAASPTWGVKVAFFIEDLSRFEKEFKETQVTAVSRKSFDTSIAGDSGKLLADSR